MQKDDLEDLKRRYTNRGPAMATLSYREWLIGILLKGIVNSPNSSNHELVQKAVQLADLVIDKYLRTEKLNEEVKKNYGELYKMDSSLNVDRRDNWHSDFENRLFQGTFKRPKIQNS